MLFEPSKKVENPLTLDFIENYLKENGYEPEERIDCSIVFHFDILIAEVYYDDRRLAIGLCLPIDDSYKSDSIKVLKAANSVTRNCWGIKCMVNRWEDIPEEERDKYPSNYEETLSFAFDTVCLRESDFDFIFETAKDALADAIGLFDETIAKQDEFPQPE